MTVASVWIPLAVRLGPANEADNLVAELLVPELPVETRFVLGDGEFDSIALQRALDRASMSVVLLVRRT